MLDRDVITFRTYHKKEIKNALRKHNTVRFNNKERKHSMNDFIEEAVLALVREYNQ